MLNRKVFSLVSAVMVFALMSLIDVNSGLLVMIAGVPLAFTDHAYRTAMAAAQRWKPTEAMGVFARMIGWIGGLGADNVPRTYEINQIKNKYLKSTGQVIEMLAPEFDGALELDVPLNNLLMAAPLHGATQRRGNETQKTLSFMHATLWATSQAVEIRSDVIQQFLAPMQQKKSMQMLFDKATLELTEWFQRYLAMQPYWALLHRYSHNITDSLVNGGKGNDRYSNPNFVIAGSGPVTYSSTRATYEGNIATALSSVTETTSTAFNTNFIRNITAYARSKGIIPAADNLYDLIIHPAQFRQLQRDELFTEAFKFALERGKDNVIIDGIMKVPYQNVMLHIDMNCPGVKIGNSVGFDQTWSTLTSGGVQYGVKNYMEGGVDESNLRACILLGKSAVVGAYPGKLNFTEDSWDYEAGKGQAASILFGFERGDIFDKDGKVTGTAGTFEKTGSVVGVTYSPYSGSWTD